MELKRERRRREPVSQMYGKTKDRVKFKWEKKEREIYAEFGQRRSKSG
jgi:hypothetical protein